MKDTEGKPRPTLIYYSLIKEISKVREYGIEKYGSKTDWQTTDPQDHLEAALRHLYKYAEGEENDDASGLNHLAHAASNIMFLIEDKYMKELMLDEILDPRESSYIAGVNEAADVFETKKNKIVQRRD